jgi:hypothetical protein
MKTILWNFCAGGSGIASKQTKLCPVYMKGDWNLTDNTKLTAI